MQSRAEFIEEHWEEALVIDAKMRQAAIACVKNFLGEEQEIPSLLTRQQWIDCGQAYGYLHELAWYYGMAALGHRILVQRPFVEYFFFIFIVNCTFGRSAALLLISPEQPTPMLRYSLRPPDSVGKERDAWGLEALGFYFQSTGQLPRTYSEMKGARWSIGLKAFKRIPKLIAQRRLANAGKFDLNDSIQKEFAVLSKEWSVEVLPVNDPESWMFEEFRNS